MALLLASTFPHLGHGAIGLVPSASAYPAPAAGVRAWRVHGKAVPLEQIPVQRISSPVLTEAVVFRRHQNAGFRGTRAAGQETWESAAATEKPSTVTRPETSPPLRTASGIIESMSMTSSAPAAKPSTAALRFPETLSAMA